jgi:ABC-type amino acid transport system permease subunit
MFEIYICLAAVYWLLSILIDWIFRLAERGLTVDRVTAKLRKEAA